MLAMTQQRRKIRAFLFFLFFVTSFSLPFNPAHSAVLDNYFEDFNSRQLDTSIDGVNYWNVLAGENNYALVQSSVTASGAGRALKLVGAAANVSIERPYAYGSTTPTWIWFKVRPAGSAQTPDLPGTGVAAISLDYTGRVLAADGSNWVDTGATYAIDTWHDVKLKLDFSKHTYDVYFTPTGVPGVTFEPVETDLSFIDTSLHSLSNLKFFGSYSATADDDVYIDDVAVIYIDRLEIITAAQKLLSDQASGAITVQLQDSTSSPQTAVEDMVLELKSSSGRGKFSLSSVDWFDVEQITLSKHSQSVTFYYKDAAVGNPIITISEYPDLGWTDASQQFEIVEQASGFDIQVTSPQVAGTGFIARIRALDEDGTVNEFYNGTVNLTVNYISPDGGARAILPESVSGFSKGVKEAALNYPDCGLITITASDSEEPEKTGVSPQILFLPASFSVSADEAQVVKRPFSLSVSALNAQGEIAPNYKGNVNLYAAPVSPEETAGAVLTPGAINALSFEDGTADVDISYNLYGTITLRVEEASDTTKQGVSGNVSFLPGSISIEAGDPPGGRDFFYTGEPVNLTVRVLDETDVAIPNYPGTIELLSSGVGLALSDQYTFTLLDAGSHTFSAPTSEAGKYKVTARAEDGALSAESESFTVKNATIQVIDTTSPVGTGEVTIQIVDDEGNIITSEDEMVINFEAVESVDDDSVYVPSNSASVTGGKAIVPVSNTTVEIITIVPQSIFKLKVRKGTITFGRAGKTGINTLLWRELK